MATDCRKIKQATRLESIGGVVWAGLAKREPLSKDQDKVLEEVMGGISKKSNLITDTVRANVLGLQLAQLNQQE